jgi:DNA-binding CsgD family transcriptional regulator
VTPEVLPPFVGRSADRERLAAVVERLGAGLSAALVVSGDAGIGKTLLLRRTVENAGGIQTVMVSGYESELGLGFAALHRLVSPFLGVLRVLPEPQRDALATAFGLAAGPAPNRFLVGLATMTLLRETARRRPLLCVVDDVQWVDQETLDTLAFVARRLDAEAVGLVFGLRSTDRTAPWLGGIPEHRLRPMPDQDMRLLLSAAARIAPAPHIAARLITESQGNPLALLEYVASLPPERLAGTAELPPALPVSERLSSVFAAQIARLPADTRQLLLVLSAAGPDAAAAEACRRLGIGPDAARPAVADSILSTQPALAFRHPLIRSVVYDSAGTAAQQRVHAALAQATGGLGSADAAAWHRAYATIGPDEDVAAQLELTAARARERGGYAAEANFLTLAAQRSITGTADHARRLLAAAHAHIIAGNGAQAEWLLHGWNPAGTGTLGARIAAERVAATQMANDFRTGVEASTLVEAAAGLPSEELDLAWDLRCEALRAALETREYTLGTTLQELAQGLLSQPWPPGREPAPLDLLNQGLAARCTSGYEAAAPLLQQALRRMRDPEIATAQHPALLTWMAMEDLWADEFESTTWTELTRLNQAHGAWSAAWIGWGSSAMTEARHGNFDTAQELFDVAASVGDALGTHGELLWSVLTEFRAWQGREAETRSMADRLIRFWGESQRYGSVHNFAHLALTLLELSLRRYTQALEHASRVARDDPPGHGTRILPDLVEAAARTGDEALAGRTLDELTARATTAATPWAMGVLARSRALVHSTSSEAEPYYQEALRLLDPTPLRTETARTHLLYGEWLRRRKRRADARKQLNASLSAFTAMGAAAFAQRAALELAASGAKPLVTSTVQRSALTPQERHVAELAAQGMTNSEISEQLFISISTVDYHLSKVFRKLEITSRRRLKDKIYG